MERIIKTIVMFIVIGILNTIVFTIYLGTTGLPGGEVGMLPLLIALESGITISLATLTYFLIRNKIEVTTIKTILIYQLIHVLTLISLGANPFESESTNNYVSLNQWTYLISFLVTVSLIITTKLVNRLNKNRS
jgi:hypothetical protein